MSISVGEYRRTPDAGMSAPNALVLKASEPSHPLRRRGPTVVSREHLSRLLGEQTSPSSSSAATASVAPRPRPPDARERRASRSKQERRQQQRADFADSAALAYFLGRPLGLRVTITWDACALGERADGHILGKPDRKRVEHLLSELRRALRKVGLPFFCIWARDLCSRRGQHVHLALHWPLSLEALVQILSRLTGSQAEPEGRMRGVLAHSECRGWQVKRNMALNEIRSAANWAGYLLDQETRHLVMPAIDGKTLGVSRPIDARAIAAHRGALEAWKVRRGWMLEERPSGGLLRPLEGQP